MNYKNWHVDEQGRSYFCDEFETIVQSGEQIKKIFSVLKFKSIAVVDKTRKIWTFGDYEIAIDAVKNLSDFVEIEYIGSDEKVDPKKITNQMIDFLKKVGCGTIKRNYVGYPFLLLFPQETIVEIYS